MNLDGEDDDLILNEDQAIDDLESDDASLDDNSDVNDTAEEQIVSFGEEEPAQEPAAPDWAKKLRKDYRLAQQEIARLKATNAPQKIEVGPMPSIDDPDIDYDNEKLSAAMASWVERRDAAKAQETEATKAQETAQQAWQAELGEYERKKSALTIVGKEEAEEIATSELSKIQQAIIVKGAANPALVIVALGKNPKKLETLSAITDPVKFAFAVASLERDLKVSTRKPPEVEGTVKGSAPLATGTRAKQLAALDAQIAKGGDVSKLLAKRRELARAH